VKIGALRDRVAIQAQSLTPNGQGGFDSAGWSDIATVWARVIGLSGDESVAAAIERASMRWRVEIRRRTDVTATHRLVWNGINLDVKAVFPHPSEPTKTTVLLCESGLSEEGN
jgi:SPP1 family predicted phage head-tail adaptor